MYDLRILVDRSPGETRVAVVRGRTLEELLIERITNPWLLGSIVLSRVTAVRPELGAVFLDLAGPDGYLEGSIKNLPNQGDLVLVEVLSEVQRGKAARTTMNISLSNELLSFTPNNPEVGISRDITAKKQRILLRDILNDVVPKKHGAIAKPAAALCNEEIFTAAASEFVKEWKMLEDSSANLKVPTVIKKSPGPLAYALKLMPDATIIEGQYGRLFRDEEIETEIFEALGPAKCMLNGAVLHIDEAEALTVIDVDIARCVTAFSQPEKFSLTVADEIFRQFKLRRIGGIILIDFPKGRFLKIRNIFLDRLKSLVSADQGSLKILGWTRTGLLEITAPRKGPSLKQILLHKNAAYNFSAETSALDALRRLGRESAGVARPILVCSPEVRLVLMGPLKPALLQVGQKLGVSVKVLSDASFNNEYINITTDKNL